LEYNKWRAAMRQKGFTLIEVVIILVIVGLLATFAAVKYLDLLSPTYRATELNAVGAIRTGISL
jgi:MSHA pilin protein MshA